MRGLKFQTPFLNVALFLSHPLWMRGLKLCLVSFAACFRQSHPLWMRGLKFLFVRALVFQHQVASFMDAWIEIINWLRLSAEGLRRILYGCVD